MNQGGVSAAIDRVNRRMPRTRHMIVGAVVGFVLACAAFLPSVATAAECTDTFRPLELHPPPKPPTELKEGTWQTPGYWSAGHVPSESDVACIPSGKTAVLSAGSRSVGAVQGEGALRVESAELQVMSSSATSVIKSVTLGEAGDLTGPGTLEVTGSLTWTQSGMMSGSGRTVLAPGATGTVGNSAEPPVLQERTFVNEGTLTQGGGLFQLSDGGQLRNKATFRPESTTTKAPAQIAVAPGSTSEPKIVNTGTILRSVSVSATTLAVELENEGTINVEKGALTFAAGTNVILANGSVMKGNIRFAGANVVARGIHASRLTIESGSFTVGEGATSTVGELTLGESGDLTGPGTLEVTGSLTWTQAGMMSGSGRTVLAPGATGTIGNSAEPLVLQERTFVNEGTLVQNSGLFQVSDGARLVNRGVFRPESTSSPPPVQIAVAPGSTSEPKIVNTGTILRSVSVSATTLAVELENEGTINVEKGALTFAAGTNVILANSSVMKGNIRFAGANVVARGIHASRLTIESGSFTVGEGATSTVGELTLEGTSDLTGPGTLEITGSLTWTHDGTMAGSGETLLAPGATGTIGNSYTEPQVLQERTFVNEGTLTQGGGLFQLSDGGQLRNKATFRPESTTTKAPAQIAVAPGSTSEPKIVNTGTILRSVSSLGTTLAVELENEGTINVEKGYLRLAADGLVLLLPGTVTTGALLDHGATIGAASAHVGNLKMESGTLVATAGATSTVGELTLEGTSDLTGPGTLEITGSLTWTHDGTMAGSGETLLAPGATGTIGNSYTEPQVLQERTFVNEGTLTQGGGLFQLSDGGQLRNKGTFRPESTTTKAPAQIAVAPGSTSEPKIVNTGRVERVVSTATTTVAVGYEEFGNQNIEKGRLVFLLPALVAASTGTPGHCEEVDPVDCATGNLTDVQTDLEIGGRGVGLTLTRTYSAQAAAAGSRGIFGYGWTNSFGDVLVAEEGGTKETLTDASGETSTFTRSGGSWVAPSWINDTLVGSPESGFTLTLPDQTEERFSPVGRLDSVTDRNGNETTLAYSGSGQLETISDPSGRTITLVYNGEGLVEKAIDPMGKVIDYAYESKDLKSVTLSDETSPNSQFEYDGSHRMTSFTDGRGGKTTNEYDSSSRVISQLDPAGHKTTFVYEPFHTVITNKATGAVKDEWFNSDNQPTSVTHGFGTAMATTTSFTYTTAGLLASRTDGDGHVTTYGYDAEGNRTSERDPEGNETRKAYNTVHQVISETTPRGEETTIDRDADGNPEMISRLAPGNETQTVSYGYGPYGEIDSMTNPLGFAWTYEYDKYGDRIAETDPEGDRSTTAYNEDSQVISKVSPRGNEGGIEAAKFTTAIERDGQGRPITIANPVGGTTRYAYDADGDVESVTDPNGNKTKFTYDSDGERIKIERPNGAVEETGFDGAGQVTSQIDGNGQKTTYVRNVLEQPVETIDPLGRKTTRTFDAAGNLVTKTDPDGRTATYGYDKANRLKEVTYSAEAAQHVSYAYDEDGALTSMVDATGESTWEYDQLGRLIHAEDGNGETVGWEYNLADEPIGLIYPNGKSISRIYDDAGRLASVTDWLGHTTSFAYDRDSDPTATTFPVGTGDADGYAYDGADRLSDVTMKKGPETLGSIAYGRDPAGQIESLVSKGLPGVEEETFGYDENERLNKAGSASYEYDNANNLTKAPGTTNAFDKASQIESATGASFTYDKEGERTNEMPSSGPTTTYKYDQASRLTAIERPEEGESPPISESFGYDGSGLLATRAVGPTATHFVWDLSESPEPLLSDGEDSYVYGPGGLAFEQISSGEVPTYIHHDQLGSTRLLTNSSGESVGTFTYGLYGGLTGHTGSATTVLGYAGQYTLGQSGMVYLRARYYDPATGQFLTLDPLASVTRAPFLYASDDPINLRDRIGQAPEAVEGGCPSPICFPLPSTAEAEGAAEALEHLPGEIAGRVSSVWNSIFGEEETSAEEAEGQGAEEAPCADETTPQIGDREQQRDEDRQFVEKLGHASGVNPGDPFWPPSGSRVKRLIAVAGKLVGQLHRGP